MAAPSGESLVSFVNSLNRKIEKEDRKGRFQEAQEKVSSEKAPRRSQNWELCSRYSAFTEAP